jgi:hypothetical protein
LGRDVTVCILKRESIEKLSCSVNVARSQPQTRFYLHCNSNSLKTVQTRIDLKGDKEVTMSVIIEFSIFPMDKGESLSPYVARALKMIQDSGLPYELLLSDA